MLATSFIRRDRKESRGPSVVVMKAAEHRNRDDLAVAVVVRRAVRDPLPYVKEFVDHYLAERFHQGIDGRLIKANAGPANDNGTTAPIICRSRLGSLLNYYHREAA